MLFEETQLKYKKSEAENQDILSAKPPNRIIMGLRDSSSSENIIGGSDDSGHAEKTEVFVPKTDVFEANLTPIRGRGYW